MPSVGILPLLDELAEQPVGRFAPFGHHLHRRVRRQAHLLRVEIVAAGQHHAVEPIEDRREVVLP